MKQELYIVSLPDYYVSPIISGATKEYIGTKEDIDDVIQDGEVVIAKQGVVLSETTYYCLAAEHTFINTYGFDYTIKTEKTEAEIVYFYEGKQYLRCVKTKMKDLQIGVDGQNYYKPDSFMGHPNILFIENGWLCSKLFAVEQVSGHRCFASQFTIPVFTPARFARSDLARTIPWRSSVDPHTATAFPRSRGSSIISTDA